MSIKLDFLGIKGKQKKIVYEDITFNVYFNTVFSKNLKQIKFFIIFLDNKELKMSSRTNPQAQKNTSASFLGFRSPFAWLFSFRKSRKNQTQKQPR